MKLGLKLATAILLSLIYICNTEAVPATPYPITITQTDGTIITYKLRGDEFFNYKTTTDGYPLIPNSKGIFTYAKLDASGKLVSTLVNARNTNKRTSTDLQLLKTISKNIVFNKQSQTGRSMRSKSATTATMPQKTYPLVGSPKSLVILVNFSDKNFVTSTPKVAFTNLLNQQNYATNGGTGSAKDYFRDNSMGVFNPQFEVVGPFTLAQTLDYYGKNTGTDDTNPQQMIIDACAKAAENGVDFSQYDTDGNKIVDNVFVYYAGYNEAEGGPTNTIWPHRWSLSNYNTKFNGVSIYDYACTSELKGATGANMCGIGTFCHEFGHVLGLDDMYVTDATVADHHTLSFWDIMDSGPYLNGGRTPPSYSAYERFYLKWLVPTELKAAQSVSLDTLNTKNKAFLISQNSNHNLNGANPNPVEFFLVENRQKKGWDTYLPGHGMLITHLFYNPSTWASNSPNNDILAMGVDIVEADGIASDQTLTADPFPGTLNVSSYSPKLRNGTDIAKPITSIKELNGIITFKFKGGGVLPKINYSGSITEFATVQSTPSAAQSITISATKLKAPLQLSFANNLHYEIKKSTDISWAKSISINPIDSTVANTNIEIRYNPKFPSFAVPQTETLQLLSTDAEDVLIALAGTSTRPIYITQPLAIAATDLTIASFVAHWEAVADSLPKLASGYYLTVYNISDGTSKLAEGFDKGLVAPAGWTINASATSTSSVYSGEAVPAIQFKKTGDYIQTEKYQLPATSLSFYIRTFTGLNGYVKVEAWNNTNWNKVDSIVITSTLSGSKNYTFNLNQHYMQFRLTYTMVQGYVIIDDVTAGFSQKLEYNAREKWVSTNSDSLFNLVSNREYYYKVKASDKKLNADGTSLYENITAFSNIIAVKTLEDKSKTNSLIVIPDSIYVDNFGSINVYLTSTITTVNVYNILGQRIKSITHPSSNKVVISGLPRKQIYIVQAGKRASKVIL